MGAVNFSLSPDLVQALSNGFQLDVLVETGTFEGDTVASLQAFFREIYSVELAPYYFEKARARFADQTHISIALGHSAAYLKQLVPTLATRSVLYYLDAHWCVASNTAGDKSQCPLLQEIGAIARFGETSVIVIDDARLFLAPPPAPHDISQWPSFDEIVTALRRLSARHELMVVNDVIVFFPPAARDSIHSYARKHGVDWLRAFQSNLENTALRGSLEEKESVIQGLLKAMEHAERQQQLLLSQVGKDGPTEQVVTALASLEVHALLARGLEEKEAVIQKMKTALHAYRAAFSLLGRFKRQTRWLSPLTTIRRLLPRPRLGVLYQHEPQDLIVPRSYSIDVVHDHAPKVSMVTPSFRQGAFIERTIRSVLDQQYPNLEYYVQDGGSEDSTREVIERHAGHLAGWESRPDKGQSQAINLGFAHTSGDIMAWLNSDDILLPGALHCVVDFFNRNPDVDVVYGHRLLIDENDRLIGRWILPAHDDNVLSWADYVPQETLFWRRSIWQKVGGQIDESFRFAMDWDLLLRFRDAGARFARIPRFLGGFRIHPHQKTSAAIGEIGFKEMDRLRERALGRVPTHAEVRRAIAPYLLRHVGCELGWWMREKLGAHR